MKLESYKSIWDAISVTQEQAANLCARAELLRQISALIKASELNQTEAANRCGITQPRMNDLLRGRISRFSLVALAGITVTFNRQEISMNTECG